METKICSKCGRELPVIAFTKDKKKKDGLRSSCKECNRQYYEEHKKEICKRNKQYQKEHKEEKGKYNKQYYEQYSKTLRGHSQIIRNSLIGFDRRIGRIPKDSLPDDYITLEQTMELIGRGKCAHYEVCGCDEWLKLGLNRLDNSKYHTFENCEPCCFECNNSINNTEQSNKVYQYEDGKLVTIWASTKECGRNGYNQSAVSKCCNGGYFHKGKWINFKKYKGCEWSYTPL